MQTPTKKAVRSRITARLWDRVARTARRIAAYADSQAMGCDAVALADDPMVDVLYRALGNRTGKLRVSDAFLICGLEAGKVNQDQIERFGRAIRELGWERKRHRYNGKLDYAYVKGSDSEREVELVVEYDPHTRSVRIEIIGGQMPVAS